ncbi:MAG: VCBS repeat-containing protein [Verrucomicrobia bacterium]|nr:VCBS repeat-containing protein [Verrucomicrobiota bacterium]
MIGNPGFETGFRRDNIWDGVDTTGALAGERGALPILTTSGTIADTSMPVSVSVADLNGDSLPDIAAMDVLGYLRVFFNAGTKTEPKFTVGELSNLFLSRISPTDPSLQGVNDANARQGQRIHLCEITRSGKKDLVIGNYLGEILLIPNSGSGVKPDYRQPSSIASAIIPTMKDSLKKWGNVFAPAVWDWNRDGKDDLLVGEGSYSANSIHLLLNTGSGSRPVFDENNRSVLAYGMGLEQLTPCIVDYNGDGNQDLLVAERTGKIAVYLNNGKQWKAGDTLAFDSFIPVGGATAATTAVGKDPMDAAKASGLLSLGGITTIASGDFNGDGLFDLVFGKSNGKVALSLNSGTKTEPKFGAPVELKGDAGTPPFNSPSGWECNFGLDRGNFYGFFSVVKEADDAEAKPAEGLACLKAGYAPSPNKIMPVPTQYSAALDKNWKPFNTTDLVVWGSPANFFTAVQSGRSPLKTGTTYIFSMKVKGSKVNNAAVGIQYRGFKKLSEAKIERGDRNSATVKKNDAEQRKLELIPFTAGTSWAEVRKEITVKFDNKDLADLKQVTDWSTTIAFMLSPGSQGGVLYIDDVKIIEK